LGVTYVCHLLFAGPAGLLVLGSMATVATGRGKRTSSDIVWGTVAGAGRPGGIF